MKSVPFVLRDHRDQLWHRWVTGLEDKVDADYREIIGSPLGERILRTFIDDLIARTEAEDYEVSSLMKSLEERTAAETVYRLTLGFTVLDMVVALQVLRGAIVDVLIDALVLDEMPSFADSLDQLKATNVFIDRLVCATMVAG